MAKRVEILKQAHLKVQDEVLPLLAHAGLAPDTLHRLTREFARLEREPVSLPMIVDLRGLLGEIRRGVNLLGVDLQDEKRAAARAVSEMDLIALALQQYCSASAER